MGSKNLLYAPEKRFPLARRMIQVAKDKIARKVKRYIAGNHYAHLIHCEKPVKELDRVKRKPHKFNRRPNLSVRPGKEGSECTGRRS
jgi:hypothetical protein